MVLYPSIAMYFLPSTAFGSFLGMFSRRVPSSNFALISSTVMAGPT